MRLAQGKCMQQLLGWSDSPRFLVRRLPHAIHPKPRPFLHRPTFPSHLLPRSLPRYSLYFVHVGAFPELGYEHLHIIQG